MTGGAAHQIAPTAHSVSIDLSQIYVAASWAGTVELAIKMILSVKNEKELADLWAYLKQFGADGKKKGQ
jgi:hypothetical protein